MGAPGRAPPARPLHPRASTPQRGLGSALSWGRAAGARGAASSSSSAGRRAQSPNHLRLHLPPLCLNATPGRGPGEGRRGFPGLAPLGTYARGHTGWTRGYAVGAGSDAQVARSPPRPGAAQQPSAPTPNSRSWHGGRWAGRTPPGPAPRPLRPAHALHDLGAGAGRGGALAESCGSQRALPACGRCGPGAGCEGKVGGQVIPDPAPNTF